MQVQTKRSAALAIMMATGLACLAEDQNAEAKADANNQTVQIQAQNIESNVATNEITFSGNVVMTMKDWSTVKGSKIVIKTDESAACVSDGIKKDVKSDKKDK